MVLGQRALALAQQAWLAAARPQADDQGLPLPEKDARFRDESWQQWPFSALKEGFKARDAWWREAAHWEFDWRFGNIPRGAARLALGPAAGAPESGGAANRDRGLCAIRRR